MTFLIELMFSFFFSEKLLSILQFIKKLFISGFNEKMSCDSHLKEKDIYTVIDYCFTFQFIILFVNTQCKM